MNAYLVVFALLLLTIDTSIADQENVRNGSSNTAPADATTSHTVEAIGTRKQEEHHYSLKRFRNYIRTSIDYHGTSPVMETSVNQGQNQQEDSLNYSMQLNDTEIKGDSTTEACDTPVDYHQNEASSSRLKNNKNNKNNNSGKRLRAYAKTEHGRGLRIDQVGTSGNNSVKKQKFLRMR